MGRKRVDNSKDLIDYYGLKPCYFKGYEESKGFTSLISGRPVTQKCLVNKK